MDYFIVIFFIEFLLIGLSSIGFILAKRFLKFSYLRILLLSYSIFILLINYAYFNLSININLIFWFFSSIFAFSIIYLFFLDKKVLIQKLKLIFTISFIPLLIFLMLSIFYGEQYYVFRGNYWDYFNYISSALLILKNNFNEISNINNSLNIPIFLEVATTNIYYRPSASLVLSFFLNIKNSNLFLLSFAFKFFLIIFILTSIFDFISSHIKENNLYVKLFYSLSFTFSFWTFYIYEIEALSHLASLPLFILLLSQTVNFFENLNKKNYFFLTFFTIVLGALFVIYIELFCIYLLLFLIYAFLSRDCNFKILIKNFKIILIFVSIFILITLPLYEFTYKFLIIQIRSGLTHTQDWWAYYGGFIIGRQNPITSEVFVNNFQSLIDSKLSLNNLLFLIHEELLNFNYKYYFLNIIPSFFGFYYLTDIKYLSNIEILNLFFLILLNIIILIYVIKNFINIIKINHNIIQLIKSYFIILISFSFILVFLKQYWSAIKLYFYLSPILWFYLVASFQVKNNNLQIKINKYIILLFIIFPIYKLSYFNDGITRYDAFPSILNKKFKKQVTWTFNHEYFKNCDLVTLNFYENNKIDRFKNLYLSFNLIFSDYKFINKYTLKKTHSTGENNCEIYNEYFKK